MEAGCFQFPPNPLYTPLARLIFTTDINFNETLKCSFAYNFMNFLDKVCIINMDVCYQIQYWLAHTVFAHMKANPSLTRCLCTKWALFCFLGQIECDQGTEQIETLPCLPRRHVGIQKKKNCKLCEMSLLLSWKGTSIWVGMYWSLRCPVTQGLYSRGPLYYQSKYYIWDTFQLV